MEFNWDLGFGIWDFTAPMKQLLILAGGKGTRLKDRLGDLPKPMIPIAGRPLLEHQIELARAHGFTDVLLSEVDGPLSADAQENLSVVRNSGQHLRALIDDILDLSALESGELRLTCKMIDVLSIGQEVVREMRIAAEAKRIEVSVVGNRAMAFADARRVRQIIGNIVGNAVKFTSKGGVTVRIDPRDGGVTIAVTDTGPGIAREDHEAIFQEYWQAGEVKRQRIGTGLGLAITRRLVQMHRGFIDLRSQLGKGSTFTIVLPSQPPLIVERPAPPAPRETMNSGDFAGLP